MSKKASVSQEYHWYIHPLDSYTNGVIAKRLDITAEKPANNKKGTPNLWECDRALVEEMKRNASHCNLKFQVYWCRGRYGKISKCPFD